MEEKKAAVQSVDRALHILDMFSSQDPELGIVALAKRLNLPKSTISRLVSTLVDHKFLVQNSHTRQYRLGSKILQLASILKNGNTLGEQALPILRSLHSETRETVYIDILEGNNRVCIESIQGSHFISAVVPVRQLSPLYVGADGKVLLAGMSDEEIRKFLEDTELKVYSKNTINSHQKIWEQIHKIRQDEFAISHGEWMEGSVAIASPIKSDTGQTIAGLGLSMPAQRASKEVLEKYISEVKKAALEISLKLGYR